MKSQSHSCAAPFSPRSLVCSSLHCWFLSGCTDQCSSIGFHCSPACPCNHTLWNQLPTPLGVDSTIAPPPVDNVDCADVQISSTLSIKAASSITNNDNASERPASPAADVAFIWDPFLSLTFQPWW